MDFQIKNFPQDYTDFPSAGQIGYVPGTRLLDGKMFRLSLERLAGVIGIEAVGAKPIIMTSSNAMPNVNNAGDPLVTGDWAIVGPGTYTNLGNLGAPDIVVPASSFALVPFVASGIWGSNSMQVINVPAGQDGQDGASLLAPWVSGYVNPSTGTAGYPLNATVVLDDGKTQVRNTIANNTSNPNTGGLGWDVLGIDSDLFLKSGGYTGNAEDLSNSVNEINQTLSNIRESTYTNVTGANASENGYYSRNTGNFVPYDSGRGREYSLSDFSNLLISGRIEGVGTALATYVDENGLVLGYQYGGSAGSFENHVRVPLAAPEGTVKILASTVGSNQYPILERFGYTDINVKGELQQLRSDSDSNTESIENLSEYVETMPIDPTQLDADSTVVDEEVVTPVTLTASNTTTSTNFYGSSGNPQTASGFGSVIFQLNPMYDFIDLSAYSGVGVSGGAFFNGSTFILGFSTAAGVDVTKKHIPEGATQVYITAPNGSRYRTISLYQEIKAYTLPNLILAPDQMPDAVKNIASTNHWKGKKIVVMGTSIDYGQGATESLINVARNRLGFELVPAFRPGLGIEALGTPASPSPRQFGSTSLSKQEYLNNGITIPETPPVWIPGVSGNTYYYATWENVITEEHADAALWLLDVIPNNDVYNLTDWNAFNKEIFAYGDGSSFESHRFTFAGALLFLMNKIYELNPYARIAFMASSRFDYPAGLPVMQAMSTQWNIPLIDIMKKMNTTLPSQKVLYQKFDEPSRNWHWTTFGQNIAGDMLTNELLLIS